MKVSEELWQFMKEHLGYNDEEMKKFREIRWSEIARRAIEERVEDLEVMNRIASKSKLTKKDVEEIRPKVEKRSLPLIGKYDKIILILGSNYLRTLSRILNDKFFHVKSKGYGDLWSKVMNLVKDYEERKIQEF